jgi:hypothetical protein
MEIVLLLGFFCRPFTRVHLKKCQLDAILKAYTAKRNMQVLEAEVIYLNKVFGMTSCNTARYREPASEV